MKLFCSKCNNSFYLIWALMNIPITEVESSCCGSSVLEAEKIQLLLESFEKRKSRLIENYNQQLRDEWEMVNQEIGFLVPVSEGCLKS